MTIFEIPKFKLNYISENKLSLLNNKLTTLLQSLSNKEMKWFAQFVASPYFNRNKDVVKLVELFRNHHPNYNSQVLDKQQVFGWLYPDRAFDEQELYNQVSFTYRLLTKFLATQQFEKDEALQQHFTLQALQERNQERHFQLAYQATKRKAETEKHRNAKYYYDQYLISGDADNFFIQQETRTGGGHLQQKVDYLDIFYFSKKLQDYCEMLNRKNIVNTDYVLHFTDELTSILAQQPELFAAVPSIAIYHCIYQTLTEPTELGHYNRLVQLLDKHADQFPKSEAREMYNYAQNYCIKQINQGKSEFLEEIFKLYKKLLKTAIIFDREQLTQWDYKNIVTVGTRLKEFDWTGKFIDDYKDFLAPSYRDNAFRFNLSSYHYAKGEWKTALKVLQEVEFTDVYYHLSGKSLLLKIYAEQEDTDALFALIEAFKTYLQRNKKVSAYQKKVHLNLIKFTKKAHRLKLKRPKKLTAKFEQQIDALQQEVAESGAITNVGWLKTQIAGIRD